MPSGTVHVGGFFTILISFMRASILSILSEFACGHSGITIFDSGHMVLDQRSCIRTEQLGLEVFINSCLYLLEKVVTSHLAYPWSICIYAAHIRGGLWGGNGEEITVMRRAESISSNLITLFDDLMFIALFMLRLQTYTMLKLIVHSAATP